jgi:hypothetical protein
MVQDEIQYPEDFADLDADSLESERTSYPYPNLRPRIHPAPFYVFCPRHKRWERLVEDEGLCEWCCWPKDECHDHSQEWEDEDGYREEAELDTTPAVVERSRVRRVGSGRRREVVDLEGDVFDFTLEYGSNNEEE